ncbi:putative transferase [Rosa chinensis]|nr:putative transferase [Rosa chinensis]
MALDSLNLSHNHLTGKIPEGIGSLHKLEALDLSGNHLWGLIPSSMTSMTALSKLNLSFNNFSGPIPSANQFLTFNDPTSFEGNSGLCGPPLPTQCSSVNDPAVKVDEDEEDKYGKLWFYASTSLGFIVGFWVAFGSLVIKRSWRHAYFQFLDNMKDKLCFCFWK